MSETLSGSCLCGGVSVSIPIPPDDSMGVCHCTDCRKSTGTVAGYFLRVSTESFHLDGKEHVKEFTVKADTGNIYRRFFCRDCGSRLWDRDSKETDYVCAGLFPPGTLPKPTYEQFVRHLEKWEKTHEGAKLVQVQS
ncbi:Mss4-like protein [Naematelia encephala]|uniref:Mss4-like protein n=1 Tax=Naematelia encephala TaxID=71784 RepID=A0A1Y2AWK2_9TREE|nr:Mss4-like protein [Naematelia encephala]